MEKSFLKACSARNSCQPSRRLGERCDKGCRLLALLAVAIYRTIGTPVFGGNCRFYPSCSEYAVTALHKHSLLPALKLIARRLGRCHPFGAAGFDPVPEGDFKYEPTKA